MNNISQPSSEGTLSACLPAALRKSKLRRWEASEYLLLKHGIQLAPATLAKLASQGGGPPFHKSVRTPLYPVEELDKFASARLGELLRSTSERSGK